MATTFAKRDRSPGEQCLRPAGRPSAPNVTAVGTGSATLQWHAGAAMDHLRSCCYQWRFRRELMKEPDHDVYVVYDYMIMMINTNHSPWLWLIPTNVGSLWGCWEFMLNDWLLVRSEARSQRYPALPFQWGRDLELPGMVQPNARLWIFVNEGWWWLSWWLMMVDGG